MYVTGLVEACASVFLNEVMSLVLFVATELCTNVAPGRLDNNISDETKALG